MNFSQRKSEATLTVKEWYAIYRGLVQAGQSSADKAFNVCVFKTLKNIKKELTAWDERQADMSQELKDAIDTAEETGTSISQLIADGDEELAKLVKGEEERAAELDSEMKNTNVTVSVYKFRAEEASEGVSGLFLMMLDENNMLLG